MLMREGAIGTLMGEGVAGAEMGGYECVERDVPTNTRTLPAQRPIGR